MKNVMAKSKGRVLVVDDEKSMREILEIFLRNEDYDVSVAADGKSAVESIRSDIFDLIISDMKMPKMGGLELLKNVKESSPDTVFVVMTAFGTTESAVEAMKLGAYDYIQKPFQMDDIRLVVKNALEKQKLQKDVSILKKQLNIASIENIIGESRAMQELFTVISKSASSTANVLII
jgi:two-component system response regulator PilR (NtrC family)